MRNLLLRKGVVFGIILLFICTVISQSKEVVVSTVGPVADAGGPYNGTNEYAIQFNGSGSYDPDGAIVMYDWYFGDGGKGMGVNPTHKYKNSGVYNVTLLVADNDGLTNRDVTTVFISRGTPPTIQLLYPVGGEILNDTVPVKWYAHDVKDSDNLSIYIYYKNVDNVLWSKFSDNPYPNNGSCEWDTTILSDGNYTLSIYAYEKDNNFWVDFSEQFQIKNHEEPQENLAPNKPSQPSGQLYGKSGLEYLYSTTTTDPDGDQVFYLWDWGDGNNSGWTRLYNSGVTASMSHAWTTKGTYSVKVKAKDINGAESNWSDPLPISMPYSYNPMHQFFEWLFQRFPNAFPLLRQLLGY
jgi:PKD repeat protein